MKNYGCAIGASVLAVAIGLLPAMAFARDGQTDSDAQVQAGARAGGAVVSATGTARIGDENASDDDQTNQSDVARESAKQAAEQSRESAKQDSERDREAAKDASELLRENLPFSLDASTTIAFSLEQLKKSIELRKEELDQEEEDASTTPDIADAVKDANPVRLAAHTLLASRELLGGIGSEVSGIARQMNDSLATTTNVELKIKSRGFFARLFFGGDSESAKSLSRAVAENKARIQILTTLMNQADVPADLKATLQAQISALQESQAHLQALADIEAKSWGLFSWRF